MKKLRIVNLKLLMSIFIFIFSNLGFAKSKLKAISYEKKKNLAIVKIEFNKRVLIRPTLLIRDNIVQLSMENTTVWPKIIKKVEINGKIFDTTLTAYQYEQDKVRFRAILPYGLKGFSHHVSSKMKGNYVELKIPLYKNKKLSRKNKDFKKDSYDEAFLNKLIEDKNGSKSKLKTMDQVKVGLSANRKNFLIDENKKEKKNSFSVHSYVVKFVAFLGLILVVIYALFAFFKKGMLKRGKLGFLDKMNNLSVLNTHFLGPKRNLMLIKAHKQVFLVGNSEKGIHFLSEISDVASLLKNGELAVAGDNFDTSLEKVDEDKVNFNLKDINNVSSSDTNKRNHEDSKNKRINMRNKSDKNISEQIKKKLKGLKALQ